MEFADILKKLQIPTNKRAQKDPSGEKKRRLFFYAIVALFAVCFGVYRACYYAVPISVEPVEVRELGLPEVHLTAGGYVIADPQITVSTRFTGRIESLDVKEGDRVERGTRLAVIRAPELKAQFEEAKTAKTNAELQFSRMETLYKKGYLSKREFEMSESEFKRTLAQYETASANFSESEVAAPVSGTVIDIIRHEGEVLTPGLSAEGELGSAILKMGDLGTMKVELDVTENDIGKVALYQPTLIFPDALSALTLNGSVVEISSMADRQKSIVQVKVAIEQAPPELKPEMAARVLFLAEKPKGKVERALLIPDEAIRHKDRHTVVYLFQDGRAKEQEVKLSEKKVDGLWRVLSGLNAGDPVIQNLSPRVQNGRKMAIEEE